MLTQTAADETRAESCLEIVLNEVRSETVRVSLRKINLVWKVMTEGPLMNLRADFSMTTAMSVKEGAEIRHEV